MCFKKDGNSREEGGLDEIPSIYGFFWNYTILMQNSSYLK